MRATVIAAAMRAEKPMMIYVTSDDATDGTTRKLEEVVFKGEKLAIGTKFFDCYKISVADALQAVVDRSGAGRLAAGARAR